MTNSSLAGGQSIQVPCVRLIVNQIARATLKDQAKLRQRIKSNALYLARPEQAQLGLGQADFFRQFARAFFALCEHHIEIEDNRHYRMAVTSLSIADTAFARKINRNPTPTNVSPSIPKLNSAPVMAVKLLPNR